MREMKSTYTFTCDRCGRQRVFSSDDGEEILREMSEWKNLNTALMPFFGESVDLCPECYEAFKQEFMTWLPSAFRDMDKKEGEDKHDA